MAARKHETLSGRQIAKVAAAGVAACASIYGFAATLGASSGGLGAGSRVVASCGSGMRFGYTARFSATDLGYVVDGIELADVPAGCQGKTLTATFYDSRGATVGSAVGATLTVSGTTQSIAVTPNSNTIEASQVSGISVVVS